MKVCVMRLERGKKRETNKKKHKRDHAWITGVSEINCFSFNLSKNVSLRQ